MKWWMASFNFFLLSCGAQPGQSNEEQWPVVPQIREQPRPTDISCAEAPNDDYEYFGKEFFLNYCNDCHSDYWSGDERFGAPVLVNFDTHYQITIHRNRILQRIRPNPPTMPPGRTIDPDDLTRVLNWLQCGAP